MFEVLNLQCRRFVRYQNTLYLTSICTNQSTVDHCTETTELESRVLLALAADNRYGVRVNQTGTKHDGNGALIALKTPPATKNKDAGKKPRAREWKPLSSEGNDAQVPVSPLNAPRKCEGAKTGVSNAFSCEYHLHAMLLIVVDNDVFVQQKLMKL